MQSVNTIPTVPARAALAGYALTALLAIFMLMDAAMHFAKPAPVVDAFAKLGYPMSLSVVMAILALISAALYALPRTAVLGAILLTAYLGGATAAQLRIDGSVWFPVVFGVLVWLALYLRDERVRALIPLRTDR